MQDLTNKIYAAFVSTVLISLITLGPAFWIVVTPFAFPLFLIFSTVFSYFAEKTYNYTNEDKKIKVCIEQKIKNLTDSARSGH